ncbi:hypothetical protein PR048_013587 [Dryococelus australis]|uniref:Uncharacterized protein n=1 Tax=Dryococelus australis TaxID=614101 RepID=A0ABQ9HSK7_9NEOP|nr:hypothetical protein PR048_013587 [Dryococelus australis]
MGSCNVWYVCKLFQCRRRSKMCFSWGLPMIHCLIHQGALCGTSIRGENVLLHRQLKQFLEDIDTCCCSTMQLAFFTDLTNNLSKFNLSLQGRNNLVSDMVGVVNRFRNKLRIFKLSLEKNELTHFSNCKEILKEFKEQDNVVDFSDCSSEIQEVIWEFNSRFTDDKNLKKLFYFLETPSVFKLKSKNLMCNLNYVIFKPISSFRTDRKRDLIFSNCCLMIDL